MFKFVMSALMLCLSLSSFADTLIEVAPVMPVNCKVYDYPTVNWIYKLEKLVEDKDEVIYEFVTSYGRCVNGKTQPYEVNASIAQVGVIRDGLVLPWQKEGAEAEVTQESAGELRVRLVFNKKILFKKKVERTLSMTYEPGIPWGQPYYVRVGNMVQMVWPKLQFPWQIKLSVDETWNSTITIM